jgi:hypothetical protein
MTRKIVYACSVQSFVFLNNFNLQLIESKDVDGMKGQLYYFLHVLSYIHTRICIYIHMFPSKTPSLSLFQDRTLFCKLIQMFSLLGASNKLLSLPLYLTVVFIGFAVTKRWIHCIWPCNLPKFIHQIQP